MQPCVLERRSLRMPMVAVTMGVLLALAMLTGLRLAAAQDSTPASAGSSAIICDAGAATPAAMESSPAASPAAMASSPVASPAAEFTPTPAGPDASQGMTTTVRTLAECVNAGDYDAAAALMTDNFIQTVLGVSGADEIPAALEGTERMVIRLLQTPETYDDGTASVIVVYEGFLNDTDSPIAERWFFVPDGGAYKLDRIEPAELPPGIS